MRLPRSCGPSIWVFENYRISAFIEKNYRSTFGFTFFWNLELKSIQNDQIGEQKRLQYHAGQKLGPKFCDINHFVYASKLKVKYSFLIIKTIYFEDFHVGLFSARLEKLKKFEFNFQDLSKH